MTEYEAIKKICEKLWDSDDPDCKYAEELGFKDQIIELFDNCYMSEDFLKWLINHDCNICDKFRQADIRERDDFETEEEWEEACEDCLMFNDNYVVISW